MFIPKWLLAAVLIPLVLILGWAVMVAAGRNPLPFPDPGSRIFAASSVQAKDAVVALMERHGGKERLRADSAQVQRSIMMDGTIINHSSPEVMRKVGGADACIGLVADDPAAAAADAAQFLQSKGFRAEVVHDVEPGMPISFVLTDALTGSCINFRRDILHMMRIQE